MPTILELLKTQNYTEREAYADPDDVFQTTFSIDNTLSPYNLSKEIASKNSIKESFLQDSEGMTALQYVAEQRLYTSKTHHNFYQVSLSFEEYTAKKYNDFAQVFSALIKPFEDKKENNHFTDLLLMQNKYGETALHSFFLKFKKLTPLRPVIDRILQLTPEQKKQIMKITDNTGQNIIHVISKEKWSFDFINDLKGDDLKDALIQQDNRSKTPLHYLFNQGQEALENIQLISKKILESKESYEEEIFLTTDNTEKNILHYALGQTNYSEAKEKLIAALCFFKKDSKSESGTDDKISLTEEQRQIFFQALTKPDANRLTPFQYACRNNHDAAVELILRSLNPEQQKILIKQDNNMALCLACRSGTKALVDKILNVLRPKEVYDIYKNQGMHLRRLARFNPTLKDNFEKTMNKKIGWFQTYDYLKQREKQSSWFHPVSDFDKRADDFIKRLNFNGSFLTSLCDPAFSNGQSRRYKENIEHLHIDQKQQEDLKLMIRADTTDPLDYKIAAALDSRCVLFDIKNYLAQLENAEYAGKYWSWNKHFDKYMADFVNCLRAIQEKGSMPPYNFDQTSLYKKLRNGLEFVSREQITAFLQGINNKSTVKDIVIRKLNESFPPSVNPSRSSMKQ